MIGVPFEGPTTMYGDNMTVVLNTTVSSSQLKKNHNAIAYNRVLEAIAGNIVRLANIPSEESIADILTKPLPVDTLPHPASVTATFDEPVVSLPVSRGGYVGTKNDR
jgi:hypothetical protein